MQQENESQVTMRGYDGKIGMFRDAVWKQQVTV